MTATSKNDDHSHHAHHCVSYFVYYVRSKTKNAELCQKFCIHADAATNQHVCAKHDETNQHVSEECPHVMFIWRSVLNINFAETWQICFSGGYFKNTTDVPNAQS